MFRGSSRGRRRPPPEPVAGRSGPSAGGWASSREVRCLLATISGYVYDNSAHNDGIRQASDPGIAGCLVNLTGTADQGELGSHNRHNQRPRRVRIYQCARRTLPAGGSAPARIHQRNGYAWRGGGPVGTDILAHHRGRDKQRRRLQLRRIEARQASRATSRTIGQQQRRSSKAGEPGIARSTCN